MSTFPGKNLRSVALIAALGISVCIPSLAQTTPSENAPIQGQIPSTQTSGYTLGPRPSLSWNVRATQLLGKDVANVRGETVGAIRDVVFNVATKDIHYVVLELGGPAVSRQLYPFPIEAFDVRSDGRQLLLTVAETQLQNAPGFSSDSWPDWNDARVRRQLDEYYGATTGGTATAQEAADMRRVGELLNRDVRDVAGREVGEVADLVIDLGESEVSVAVLDFDTAWNVEDRLLPVPMGAVAFPRERGQDLVVDTETVQAAVARGFGQQAVDLGAPDLEDRLNEWFLVPERPPVPGQAGIVTETAPVIEE